MCLMVYVGTRSVPPTVAPAVLGFNAVKRRRSRSVSGFRRRILRRSECRPGTAVVRFGMCWPRSRSTGIAECGTNAATKNLPLTRRLSRHCGRPSCSTDSWSYTPSGPVTRQRNQPCMSTAICRGWTSSNSSSRRICSIGSPTRRSDSTEIIKFNGWRSLSSAERGPEGATFQTEELRAIHAVRSGPRACALRPCHPPCSRWSRQGFRITHRIQLSHQR